MPGNNSLNGLNSAKTMLDGNIAMFAFWGQAVISNLAEAGSSMNWDLASYPYFKETPNKNPEISTNVYVVSKAGKHIDEAFQVVSFLSSSAEVQNAESEAGLLPVITINNLKDSFGKNLPVLQGKHVEAIFRNTSAEDHLPSRYDNIAQKVLNKQFESYLKGETDVRTALSRAEEEVNQSIAAEKSK
jgi:multiple sugar transport system substrate-binding protein